MLSRWYKQFLDSATAKTDFCVFTTIIWCVLTNMLSVCCFYYYLSTDLRWIKFLKTATGEGRQGET